MTDAQYAILYELLTTFRDYDADRLGALDLAAVDITRTIVDEMRSNARREQTR